LRVRTWVERLNVMPHIVQQNTCLGPLEENDDLTDRVRKLTDVPDHCNDANYRSRGGATTGPPSVYSMINRGVNDRLIAVAPMIQSTRYERDSPVSHLTANNSKFPSLERRSE